MRADSEIGACHLHRVDPSGAITIAADDYVKPNGLAIAAATEGDVTRLGGGLPIVKDGIVVGEIGVGSGSPDQDKAVAQAATDSILG